MRTKKELENYGYDIYRVKNLDESSRKFWDSFFGEDIHIKPGKSVLTFKPPAEGDFFKVTKLKKKDENENIKKDEILHNEEVTEDDSSSSS